MKRFLVAFLSVILVAVLYTKLHKKPEEPSVEDPIVVPEPPPDDKDNPKIELPEFNSYQEALAAAKKHNMQLFLFFEADWCVWCKKMKNTVLSDAEVKQKLSKYVICFVDVDKDKQTARKFAGVTIPVYTVISNNEKIVRGGTGYREKKQFLEWLSK